LGRQLRKGKEQEKGGKGGEVLTLPMHPGLIVLHSLKGDPLLIPGEELGMDRISRHHENGNDAGDQRAGQVQQPRLRRRMTIDPQQTEGEEYSLVREQVRPLRVPQAPGQKRPNDGCKTLSQLEAIRRKPCTKEAYILQIPPLGAEALLPTRPPVS
jgi:hypothetical protein